MPIYDKEGVNLSRKIIQDIRLYKSESEISPGCYNTVSFADKRLNAVVKRIVMKLRENGFSLGEFDHLYINFTTCELAEDMVLSDKADRYHPWYRYCAVRIGKDAYARLGAERNDEDIVRSIGDILTAFFATGDFPEERIRSCVDQAVAEGGKMLMFFKEKITSGRRAVIFLRYLDSCRFHPLLRVYDLEGKLLFETDLPEMILLDALGDIRVSSARVTIKPRKNAFTAGHPPMVFEY